MLELEQFAKWKTLLPSIFPYPLSVAAGSCSGCSQMLSLLAQGSGTGGFAQISQVWDGGFESVWEL